MSEPSPETHVFVGMFRPPMDAEELATCPFCKNNYGETREEVVEVTSSMYPGKREELFPVKRYRWEERLRCWQSGHFDTPVYKTIEEVVRMREDK